MTGSEACTEHPIIALWAHPRSMSTALERVMRARGDLDCAHEPFMYDYYIYRQTKRLPMFEPEKDHPVSYADVRDMVLQRANRGAVFFKDMSYYVMPHLVEDAAFCARMRHSFVVRDPMAAIASYIKLDPDLTSVEVGIEAQWHHYEALCAAGLTPIVVLSNAVRNAPKPMISAYWQALGLSDLPHALQWSKDVPDDWQQVAGWHSSVMASEGIQPITDAQRAGQVERFEMAAQRRPDLRDICAHHQRYYDKFAKVALVPTVSDDCGHTG